MTFLVGLIHGACVDDPTRVNTLTALGSNAVWFVAFVILLCFFSIFRDGKLRNIYAPRKNFGIDHVKNQLPILSEGWRWFTDIIDISDESFLNSCGLDAHCLAKVFSLAGRWCIFWTIFATVPLLFLHNMEAVSDDDGKCRQSFETSPLLVPQTSRLWYVHFVYYYLITFSLYYFIFRLNSMFISLRQTHLMTAAKRNYINSRSIMVQGIPHAMRSSPYLKNFFESMNIGDVEKVIVFRNFDSLLKIIKRRYMALINLEKLYDSWLKAARKDKNFNQNLAQSHTDLLSVEPEDSHISEQPVPPKLPSRKASNQTNDNYELFFFSSNAAITENHTPLPHSSYKKLPLSLRPMKYKKCFLPNALAPLYWFIYHLFHFKANSFPKSYQIDAIDHYFEKFKKFDLQTVKVRTWYKQNIDNFDEEFSATYRSELENFSNEQSRQFIKEQYLEFKTLTKRLLEISKLDNKDNNSRDDLEANEVQGLVDMDDFLPTSSAIVTFKSTISAQVASQILMHRVPIVLKCTMAPSYTDLFYKNLSFPPIVNYLRYSLILLGIFALIIFWNIVIGGITVLITDYFLNAVIDSKSTSATFIRSILPPIIINVSVAFLPLLFTMTAKFQGLHSWSRIEHDVIVKYFTFLVLNVLILYQGTVSGLQTIQGGKINEIQTFIQKTVIQMASVMVTYVLLQSVLSIPLDISRFSVILVGKLTSIFQTTPREASINYKTAPAVNYGSLVPIPSFVFLLAIVYSVIEPMMMPVCAFFFLVERICKKYCFLFIYERRYETGGKLIVNNVTNFTFCALILFHVFSITFLGSKFQFGLSAGVLPLLILDVVLIYYANTVLRERLTYLPGSLISEQQVGSPEYVEPQPDVDISNAQAYGDEERIVFGNYHHVLPQHHPDLDREYQHPAISGKLSKIWVATEI